MRVKILFILICSILFLQNCAPSQITKMAALPSSDQKTGYDGTITSQKRHFVSLSPYSELDVAKDRTMFMLVIQNYGEGPISVSHDDISVIFEGNIEDWASKRIRLQSLNDLIKELEEEYDDKEKKYLKSELEDIKLDKENADYLLAQGLISAEEYESMLEDIADDVDVLNNQIDSMRANNQLLLEGLPDFDMKSQTIMPGESHTGILVCDTRDINDKAEGIFQVVVSVDGEEHRFTFNRSLSNKKQ